MNNTYKVYVAAPYEDAHWVRVFHRLLNVNDFEFTSSWAEQATGVNAKDKSILYSSPADIRIHNKFAAVANDDNVIDCDAMVVVARPGVGAEMFAEARLAIHLGKKVIWVGRLSLSAWRDGVVICSDLENALDQLSLYRRMSV